MPHNRFFARPPLTPGPASLPPEELHHLTVMRLREGESFELIDGEGTLAEGKIVHGKPEVVRIIALESAPVPCRIIAQAIPQATKLDWLVEKCAELGANELWLFPAERSEKKQISPPLFERLQKIALAAAKQSGRLFQMPIRLQPPIAQWKSDLPLFYGDAKGTTALPENDFIFVVGPEKGLSDAEKKRLGQSLSLSRYTLRTETAALVMLAKTSQ